MFRILVVNSLEHVRTLVDQGYCPVECSIGGQSIVDDLKLDHHGEFSALEGVAIRSYRDMFGARAHDRRFVVAGEVDADAAFAIAALAGTLPPNHAKTLELAEVINSLDTDPLGTPPGKYVDVVRMWQALTDSKSEIGGIGGVALWGVLANTMDSPRIAPMLSSIRLVEEDRRSRAYDDFNHPANGRHGPVLFLAETRVWGFDVWYGRNAPDQNEVASWDYPVVVARTSDGNVTIGCPNKVIAEKVLGDGGLKNVFPRLRPEGWGGREAVGGSPRGQKLTIPEAQHAARVIADYIEQEVLA